MMKENKTVVVGTLGAGYAARLHGNGYKKVSGVQVRLKTVCDLNTELAKQVTETLKALDEDGTVKQLCEKYADQGITYDNWVL